MHTWICPPCVVMFHTNVDIGTICVDEQREEMSVAVEERAVDYLHVYQTLPDSEGNQQPIRIQCS